MKRHGVKAESKFSSTNSQRLSSSKMTATGTGSFWLQPQICEIQFRTRACVLYLSLLCAPCIRSVNNGYIEFSQQANKVVHSENKSKNFHIIDCFEPTDLYVNAEKRNCMKLGSIKASYCTMPETNRFDFKIIFEIRIRNWIRWGHYLILDFTFQPTSANSFERTEWNSLFLRCHFQKITQWTTYKECKMTKRTQSKYRGSWESVLQGNIVRQCLFP